MNELSNKDMNLVTSARLGDATIFRRNAFVNLFKVLLVSSHSVLPDSIFKPLYESSFAFYKSLLRLAYFRRLAYRWLSGDRAGLTRAKMVYEVMRYSLVGSTGLEATFDAASDLIKRGIPGDFVECGVAQGGCSALMAMVARTDAVGRKMWLFDSFQGLPSPTPADFDENRKLTGNHIRPLDSGSCLGARGQVELLLFSTFGLDRGSVFLIEGWFQETLSLYKDRVGQISLLRIDGDWYESTICCFRNLYDKVAPGGCVIIDDYGACYGCKKAVHEFFEGRGFQPNLVSDGRGGVLFSKPM
jgi:O-methyltransferase